MRIFHLINGNTTVGAITSIKKIVNEIDPEEFIVGVLSYNKLNNSGINENIRVKFCDLKFNRYLNKFLINKNVFNALFLPYYFVRDIFLLRQFVKENNVDVIHTHYLNDNFIATFLPSRVKKVAHIRSIINRNFLFGYGFKYYKHRIYNNSDLVIGISNTVLAAIGMSLNHKVKLVYNGIKQQNEISENPAFHIFNGNSFLIGCVSRFVKDKGLEFLIELASKTKERGIDVKFLIVAPENTIDEINYKNLLIDKVNQLSLVDSVLFMGSFPNSSYFMPYFQALIHPTLQREGFGNVILEAFLYGLPVLSTNCGGPSEIIDQNKNGFIIDDLNSDKFVEMIIYLMNDKEIYRDFSDNAKSKAMSDIFSLKENIKLIEKYYRNI